MIKWYSNGKKINEFNFRNGKLEGYSYIWDGNGTVKGVWMYENGQKNGLYVKLNNDGSVFIKTYSNGKIETKEDSNVRK